MGSRAEACSRSSRRTGIFRWALGLTAGLIAAGCAGDYASVPTSDERALELAGTPSQCNAANTGSAFIPTEIAAQFKKGHQTAVSAKCANILRDVAQGDDAGALEKVVDLAGFIQKHSTAGSSPAGQLRKIQLINAFLCLVDCSLQIPEDASNVFLVPPGGAGPLYTLDGKAGYLFPPGWSDVPRIVFSEPLGGGFLLDVTSLDQFGAYFRHGTIPADAFDQKVFLAQCADAPGVPNANLRLAKNLTTFDDPDGTEVEGIEFFPALTLPGGFVLPDCPVPLNTSQVSLAGSGGAAAGLAGGKGAAGNGLGLAGKVGTGTLVSAFSEWGIVDVVGGGDATITGLVFESSGEIELVSVPVEGATVSLFCDGATTPTAVAITGANGRYDFESDDDGFAVGSDCFLFAEKRVEDRFTDGQLQGVNPSGAPDVTFEVDNGTNTKDIEVFFVPDPFCTTCDS